MRVVAGTVGGRRLAVPPGRSTRPTTALVRQAVFNGLEARGALEGATIADLFAGSGAMGIEALSRGAARAVFVESDRRAARVVEGNIAALGLASRAKLAVVDVDQWARRLAPREGGLDLVFADPPYGWDGWVRLLGALARLPTGLVVAESDGAVEVEGWEVVASRRHGGTVVSQLRPRGASPP